MSHGRNRRRLRRIRTHFHKIAHASSIIKALEDNVKLLSNELERIEATRTMEELPYFPGQPPQTPFNYTKEERDTLLTFAADSEIGNTSASLNSVAHHTDRSSQRFGSGRPRRESVRVTHDKENPGADKRLGSLFEQGGPRTTSRLRPMRESNLA